MQLTSWVSFRRWELQKSRQSEDLWPCVQQMSWEALRLLGLQRISQAVSLCVAVLLGSVKTVEFDALSATYLLGCLQAVGSSED